MSKLTHDETETLTDNERGILSGLVRSAIRKTERNRISSQKQWGDDYDSSAHDARLALLESTYRKLGGDPDRISNRPEAS